MAKHLSNLSGLGLDRDGVTKRSVKAHMAALQQQIRDLQEEMVRLTGGGRGQVPTTTKTPFRLTAPESATAIDKLEAKQGLRTGTKSQVRHDLVTKKELDGRVAQAAGASGFMDLLTDQIVASGNKDFGSISLQPTTYTLNVTTSYTNADLSGSTVWYFVPNAGTITAGPVLRGIVKPPNPERGFLRILIWMGTNSALRLAHLSTAAGVATTSRIHTMSLTTADTLATPQLITTTGPGVFWLWYDFVIDQWIVISRQA